MVCLQCGAEYVPGIQMCADCGKTLVQELPEPDRKKPLTYEQLLSTYNQGDIALIKSILDDGRIDYYFTGEMFNVMDPLIQPVALHVKTSHVERARELLGGMQLTFLGVTTG
jgi:hypothetical protein